MKKVFLMLSMIVLMIPPAAFSEDKDGTQFHQGTIEWTDRCVMEGYNANIRVSDADMNKDSDRTDNFDIKIWSDSDRLEKNHTVTETGKDTGIFESMVYFRTLDDSSGHRVRAFDGDNVYAKYVDETLPDEKLEKEKISIFTMSDLRVIDWLNHEPAKLLYDPCTIMYLEEKGDVFLENIEIYYPAPLKQTESGLFPDEIKCKINLELVHKHDKSSACVKPESSFRLLERGWIAFDMMHAEIKNTM